MGIVDPVQLTAQVRESLKACLVHSSAISATASNANRLRGEAAQGRPLGELGDHLERAYATLGQQTEEEIRSVHFHFCLLSELAQRRTKIDRIFFCGARSTIDETVALLDALEALYQAPTPREATPGTPFSSPPALTSRGRVLQL